MEVDRAKIASNRTIAKRQSGSQVFPFSRLRPENLEGVCNLSCGYTRLNSFSDPKLKLDHIQNPRHRPPDELFADHFMQSIFKHMKGAGESEWTSQDGDDTFGEGYEY